MCASACGLRAGSFDSSLRFLAQDFGCGLSRPQSASTFGREE
jgi:hypothetical protein